MSSFKMFQSKCPNQNVIIKMSLNSILNKPENGHPTLQSKTFRHLEPAAGCPRVKLTSEERNKFKNFEKQLTRPKLN